MRSPVEAGSETIGEVARSTGLHRVHLLAWRDLDDVEAGGSEVHAHEIATRWAAAGLDVLLRTSHAVGQVERAQRNGYQVVRRRGRHLVFLDAPLQELARRDGRRDGLLEVWNGLPFFAPLWARGPKATFIHHVHADMWAQTMSPGLARLGHLLETRVAPALYRGATILTPTESSRGEIVDRLGLPAAQVRAVPNGVDERFTPGGERASTPLVVAVGRLVPHKRVDLVVRAVSEARREVPDLELRIIGDGYERPTVANLIDELGAGAWVHLDGRVTDERLVELYRAAWAVVSASSAEGWGMTITEAGACGTPAIATRIAGHRDVIDDGISGMLVEQPADLPDAIRRIVTDPDLRARLGAGARASAASLSRDQAAVDVLRGIAGQLDQ